jgi:hypothetical protein
MTVRTQKQEVTVTESNTNQVSTEASNNASALVLRPEDLDALPDDPDDLQADLEALAGPSAGPGGPLGKHASFFIYVDWRQIDENGIINATIPRPTSCLARRIRASTRLRSVELRSARGWTIS